MNSYNFNAGRDACQLLEVSAEVAEKASREYKVPISQMMVRPGVPHSMVKIGQTLLHDLEFTNALNNVVPGGIMLAIGPDLPSIDDYLKMINKEGSYLFSVIIAVLLPMGIDSNDNNRYRQCSTPLEIARQQCYYTGEITSTPDSSVYFYPYNKINSMFSKHNGFVSCVTAINSWISIKPSEKVDLLYNCNVFNLVHENLTQPLLLEMSPHPEELHCLKHEWHYNPFWSYKIRLQNSLTGKKYAVFSPADNENDVQTEYNEDLDNWIENTHGYWRGSHSALKIQVLARKGVMVCFTGTLVFDGFISCSRQSPYNFVILPAVDANASFDKIDMVLVPWADVDKLTSLILSKTTPEIDSAKNDDEIKACFAHKQLRAHVMSIHAGNASMQKSSLPTDFTVDVYRASVFRAYCLHRSIAGETWKEKMVRLFRSLIGTITSNIQFKDFLSMFSTTELKHATYGVLGANKEETLSGQFNLTNIYRDMDGKCLPRFYESIGLPFDPNLQDVMVSDLENRTESLKMILSLSSLPREEEVSAQVADTGKTYAEIYYSKLNDMIKENELIREFNAKLETRKDKIREIHRRRRGMQPAPEPIVSHRDHDEMKTPLLDDTDINYDTSNLFDENIIQYVPMPDPTPSEPFPDLDDLHEIDEESLIDIGGFKFYAKNHIDIKCISPADYISLISERKLVSGVNTLYIVKFQESYHLKFLTPCYDPGDVFIKNMRMKLLKTYFTTTPSYTDPTDVENHVVASGKCHKTKNGRAYSQSSFKNHYFLHKMAKSASFDTAAIVYTGVGSSSTIYNSLTSAYESGVRSFGLVDIQMDSPSVVSIRDFCNNYPDAIVDAYRSSADFEQGRRFSLFPVTRRLRFDDKISLPPFVVKMSLDPKCLVNKFFVRVGERAEAFTYRKYTEWYDTLPFAWRQVYNNLGYTRHEPPIECKLHVSKISQAAGSSVRYNTNSNLVINALSMSVGFSHSDFPFILEVISFEQYEKILTDKVLVDIKHKRNDLVLPGPLLFEEDSDYKLRLGEYIFDNLNMEPATPFTRGRITDYYLYDDAYLPHDDVPISAIHKNAIAYLKKLNIEKAPKFLSVRNGVNLYTCPTGKYYEFRYGNYKPNSLDELNVSNYGAPRYVHKTGAVTYKFKELIESIKNAPINHSRCTSKLCGVHSLASTDSDLQIFADIYVQHTDEVMQPSRIPQIFKSGKALESAKYWRHIPSRRLVPRDMKILNDPYVQKEMFKRTTDYSYNFDKDPLFLLQKENRVFGFKGVAGCGKSTFTRELSNNKNSIYVASYRKVVDENEDYFYKNAFTFEIGVTPIRSYADLPTDKKKIQNLILDEAHAMGPIFYWYAAKAYEYGWRLFVLGDPYQIPWSRREEGDIKDPEDKYPEYKVAQLCSHYEIFNIPCEFSFYSWRIGPTTARMVQRLCGIKIVGMNIHQVTERVYSPDLDTALQSNLDDHRGGSIYITLTQSAKQHINMAKQNGEVMTATESGGITVPNTIVYLLNHEKPNPHPVVVDGRKTYPHAYVALTRSNRSCLLYDNKMIGDGRYTDDLNDTTLTEFTEIETESSDIFYGRLIRGFASTYVVIAAPSSGKTTFINQLKTERRDLRIGDTDENLNGRYDLVVTNRHEIDYESKGSKVVFVHPSRSHFARNIASDVRVQSDADRRIRYKWREEQLLTANSMHRAIHNNFESIYKLLPSPAMMDEDEHFVTKRGGCAFGTTNNKLLYARMTTLDTYEVVGDKLRAGKDAGTISHDGRFVMFGTPNPNFTIYEDKNGNDPFLAYLPNSKHILEKIKIYDEYSPCITTGQFHPNHVHLAEQIITETFSVFPIVNNNLYIGHAVDFNQYIADYEGAGMKINFYSVFKRIPQRSVLMFAHTAVAQKYQWDNDMTQAAGALLRYGPKPFAYRVRDMPSDARIKYLKEVKDEMDFQRKNITNYLFDTPIVYDNEDFFQDFIKHSISYATDQSNKGEHMRTPVLSELEEPPQSMTHSMKVQSKTPDERQDGVVHTLPQTVEELLKTKGVSVEDYLSGKWIFKNKSGQPVQVGRVTWSYLFSGFIRWMSQIIFSKMGKRIRFMGPGYSLNRLWAELINQFSFQHGIEGDIDQCDASHIPEFLQFVREFIIGLCPTVDSWIIDAFIDYMEVVMSDWICRNRSGSVKATILGQLASGTLWTFLLNCLWSMYQTCCLMRQEHTLEQYHKIMSVIVIAIAGDDLIVSTPGFHTNLKTGTYQTLTGVKIKIINKPGTDVVNFCHHTFSPNGVFKHPVRTLSQIMSKGLQGKDSEIIEQIDEMKISVFDLYQRFRDPEELAAILVDRNRHFGENMDLNRSCIDLLLRFCNTPSKKLSALLHPVVLTAAHC